MTQKQRLLNLFSDGLFHSNYQLVRLMINYKGRMCELRQEGYQFDRKHIGGSEWAWKMVGKPLKREPNGQLVMI